MRRWKSVLWSSLFPSLLFSFSLAKAWGLPAERRGRKKRSHAGEERRRKCKGADDGAERGDEPKRGGKNGTRNSTPSFSTNSAKHQFDAAFLAALSSKVSGKASFKGRLDTYRFCDSVWTFVLRDAVVKLPAGPGGRPPAREELVKKVKVVAVDSRLAAART